MRPPRYPKYYLQTSPARRYPRRGAANCAVERLAGSCPVGRLAGRCAVRSAALPYAIRTSHTSVDSRQPSWPGGTRRLHHVQLIGFVVFQHIPLLGIAEHVDALGRRLVGANDRAGFGPFFALDAQANERPDLAAELDGLLLGQVAEVFDLQVA